MPMSDDARSDRLEDALEAAEANPRSPRLPADPDVAELLRIALDLRDLPRPDFRARLGADLLRRAAAMTTAATTRTTERQGIRSVTAYLAVRPAAELIDFVKEAFGADELMRTTGGSGGLHAEVRIGDTRIMIGGGSAW